MADFSFYYHGENNGVHEGMLVDRQAQKHGDESHFHLEDKTKSYLWHKVLNYIKRTPYASKMGFVVLESDNGKRWTQYELDLAHNTMKSVPWNRGGIEYDEFEEA